MSSNDRYRWGTAADDAITALVCLFLTIGIIGLGFQWLSGLWPF